MSLVAACAPIETTNIARKNTFWEALDSAVQDTPFHCLITSILREGKVPQRWKDTTIMVVHEKKDRTGYGNTTAFLQCLMQAKCSSNCSPGDLKTARERTCSGRTEHFSSAPIHHGQYACCSPTIGNISSRCASADNNRNP